MWGKRLYQTLKNKNKLTSVLITDLNIFLIILILIALSNNLGIFDKSIMLILALYLLIGVALLNLPIRKTFLHIKKDKSRIKILFGLFLIFVCFLILLITKNQMLWVASIPLFISGLNLINSQLNIKRKEKYILLVGTYIYAIFYILLQTIPLFWNILRQISIVYSKFIGLIIGRSLILGPSVSGLWIVIIFLIFSLVTILLSDKKQYMLKIFILSTISIFFIWSIYIIILSFVGFEMFYIHFILVILCSFPIFWIISKYDSEKLHIDVCNFKKFRFKKLIKNGFLWAVIFVFLSTIILTTFIGEEKTNPENQKILFYGQNMLGTWDIPEYGKYGREASGMFGLLPIYLESSGYFCELVVDNITKFLNITQPDLIINNSLDFNNSFSEYITIERYVNITDFISIIESDVITEDILSDVQVFVVANINNSFSKSELDTIWNFVEKGGSLLVLGDHTNVGEIQQPLNDLIKPADIKFRFDSAIPIDSKFRWLNSYNLLHHPTVSNIEYEDELQISVGASLDISYNSFPVIVGKYAFSDIGDTENKDFAYLGDYEHNSNEQLGDIVLVAGSYFGSGKVIVFGDTSSFQNSAMAYSYPFIRDIFTWLNSEKTGSLEIIKIVISLIFLIAALLSYIFLEKKHVSFMILPITLCLALICSSSINPMLIDDNKIVGDVVYINATHGERFTLEAFSDESLNGLILNLNRNGYLPIFNRKDTLDNLKDGKIIILNAPTRQFSSSDISFLKKYMSNGGFVVLATGYNDKEASQSLLNEFDLDIEGVPLGPVPYGEEDSDEYENETRFVDSWPIIYDTNSGTSYYSFNFTWNEDLVTDYHLMIFVKHGLGGLLLISDSQYLLDKNIESIYDYWPGNILMLKHIIDEFKEMGDGR